ncbi:hypothetical protein F5Y09DRAFT_301289 [Xylaria sp. FL1042]|nr:hypothetical protein F5Y09DRAFT_301289 [Xylaria sp. FL1042]
MCLGHTDTFLLSLYLGNVTGAIFPQLLSVTVNKTCTLVVPFVVCKSLHCLAMVLMFMLELHVVRQQSKRQTIILCNQYQSISITMGHRKLRGPRDMGEKGASVLSRKVPCLPSLFMPACI